MAPHPRSRSSTPLSAKSSMGTGPVVKSKRVRSKKRQKVHTPSFTSSFEDHSPCTSNKSVGIIPASASITKPGNTASQLPAATSIHLKPFRPVNFAAYVHQPEAWFVTLESDFSIENITDERLKCRIARDCLSKHLPTPERIKDCFDLRLGTAI